MFSTHELTLRETRNDTSSLTDRDLCVLDAALDDGDDAREAVVGDDLARGRRHLPRRLHRVHVACARLMELRSQEKAKHAISIMYTVFHPLVVEVLCVLFLTQPASMVHDQNTRNFYHKRMKDGVALHQKVQND